jgi:Protein of unknown function (DUF1553)/Protein of unknown function (DUF1549)/Planctomycete cytochrome C
MRQWLPTRGILQFGGVVLVFISTSRVVAGPAQDFFETNIRPLLVEHCFQCHSDAAGKSKGGLKLDSQAHLLAGGDSGPAVIPGKPNESIVFKAAKRNDAAVSAMPPEKPLSDAQVQDLQKWIADGAVYPGGEKPKLDPTKHWAFQPVKRPPVPVVHAKDWPRSDVDRFLIAKLEAAKLTPSADANPATVARRVSFSLTGLPPTPADLMAIRSGGPDAISKYVDRLLASPQFGERWARHWMDLVRYADSCGHEYDYEFQGAWRYRDYLVRAFNTDLPFDRFTREQVAGDLLPPRVKDGRNEAVLGTGWWQLQEQAAAPVDLPNDEAERLDNQLDVLGKAFNGLTIGCARCHDHKFDPIRTKEYYGLFGIAAASPAHRTWANGPVFDEIATKLKTLRDELDAKREKPKPVKLPELKLRDNQKLLGDFGTAQAEDWNLHGHAELVTPDNANLRGVPPGLWSGLLSRKLPAFVRSPQFILEHDHIDVLVQGQVSMVQVIVGNYQMVRGPIYDGLRKPVQASWQWVRFNVARWKGRRTHVELFTGKADPEHRIMHTHDHADSRFGLRAVVLSNGAPPPIPTSEKLDTPPDTFAKQSESLAKTIPDPERFIGIQDINGADLPVFARGDASKPKTEREPRRYLALANVQQPLPRSGSGRRELAEVLASSDNPLTSRVVVNRIWQHLFGTGIVSTVDNFGLLGEAPTHPELLDFLAHRFVHEHHWSMKKLIRELVLTRAFQIQSGPAPEADASNRLLSRFPLRRLEAEAIRDSILAVSGQLDLTLGGEPVPVPHNLGGTGSDGGNNYPVSGPIDGQRRRSLYLAARRSFPSVFLDVFDKPASLTTFGKRDVSNVPTQALTLLNDPFVQQQAKAWGKQIRESRLLPDERVKTMFVAAFARESTDTETKRALDLVGQDDGGWDDLALTLFNLKEFIHVP